MRLEIAPLDLTLAHTWTIARGSSTAKRNALVTLEAEGVTGFGEAAPNTRYGQSFDGAVAAFARARDAVRDLAPTEHAAWLTRVEAVVGAESEVTAAIDMALWDWRGKREGVPVWRLLGVARDAMPATSFTIGIDAPDAMRAKVREAARYPLLKIKVGLGDDEANVRAVRAETDKVLRVDANEGWKNAGEARARIAWLATQGVELIEQPLAAADLEGARSLFADAPIPIVADESSCTAADLAACVGRFHGVNVKLSKCGGITRAVEMVAAARALGFRTMLGCMIESSLGIAAAASIAPLFDWVDLDGNLLLSTDPFQGLDLSNGRWLLGEAPGLGVARSARPDRRN